jgi:hypothetical protein
MVSKQFEEQFHKFCVDNNVEWDDKKRRWSKPFHPKIKNIWIQSDQGDFLNSLHPKEKGYYESKFLGWELGTIRKEYCFWCGRIIDQTRRNNSRSESVKFCNPSHRKAFGKVKADQEKLGKMFVSE